MPVIAGGVRVRASRGTPRPEFDPAKFEQAIDEKGYRALWSKVAICPHRNPSDPLAHDPSHTSCDNGYVYYDPREIRVLMTSIGAHEQYRASGKLDAGTAYATVKRVNRISFFDRLELLDSSIRFMQLVERTVEDTDRLRYTAVDLLRIEDDTRVYKPDVDYVLDDGKIRWLDGGATPEAGVLYSASYEHRPVYVVTDLVHQIRDSRIASENPSPFPTPPDSLDLDVHSRLPMQAVVKLDFLIHGTEG